LSLAVFQQGRLLTVLSGGQTPAAAAVVLEGNDHPEMDAWARALDASSTGAVLAALGTPGKVATTVAQAGTPAGEIVVVLAMQARAHGQTGNYGPGVLPTLG
jgi:hypothetical protein